jgi:hypothetical protein
MNAGDFFVSAEALRRLFAAAPPAAEVVYGHHIYRHTNGADELRLAAGFEWMWSRLQEGNFNVEYPAGFPSHQATAVRTRLVRKLKFDPLFRIAADHDLLWRAWRHKAKFSHSDEVVSVYVGGGYSARQLERCKQEWCVIALRYGPRTFPPRFQNCTQADAAGAIELDCGDRSERFVKWFGRTTLGRIPVFGTLAKNAAAVYLWVAKKLYLNSWGGLEPSTGRTGGMGNLERRGNRRACLSGPSSPFIHARPLCVRIRPKCPRGHSCCRGRN